MLRDFCFLSLCVRISIVRDLTRSCSVSKVVWALRRKSPLKNLYVSCVCVCFLLSSHTSRKG